MRRPWDEVIVEPDPDHVVISSDGKVRSHNNLIMSDRMVGEVRSGYRCINCLEGFEEAWPKQCHVCKFEVSEKQARRFGMEFIGNVRVGPSVSLEEELAALAELEERENRFVEKPSIIVPRGFH